MCGTGLWCVRLLVTTFAVQSLNDELMNRIKGRRNVFGGRPSGAQASRPRRATVMAPVTVVVAANKFVRPCGCGYCCQLATL